MTFDEVYQKVKEDFTQREALKRFYHMERTMEMALELNECNHFNLDSEKIKIAAILHDYAKMYTEEEAKDLMKKVLPDDEYISFIKYPSLWHTVLSAKLSEMVFKITDVDIIEAIKYHTTGKPMMGKLAELIYVADTVERERNYPTANRLREIAHFDFDGVLYKISTLILIKIAQDGYKIHPLSRKTQEYFYQKHLKGRKQCSKIPN